ncbi:MAG TPA: recombinase family protein [Tepidisphaeraceae bacterium]|nr:recombinase family protein [Tepidisphaeraceae bacterium]
MKTAIKKLNTTRPLVISYLRFSLAVQAKGDSTRRQSNLAETWCEQNGQTLTDRLDDKGISAFRGRNSREGALSSFLELVQAGTVPEGSTLLVEELDRLSRQEPEESLHLFLSIIRSGITLVTLNTGDVFRRGEIDMGKLMIAVVKFATAHDESAKKSFRLAAAWKHKRTKIGAKPLTSIVPKWLTVREGKVVADHEKTAVVKQIYEWAMEGHGHGAICRKANNELKAIGRKAHFVRSYVAKILHNRAVIGEFQPHSIVYANGKKTRQPAGEAIKGYYPAIIDEQTFNAVQTRMASNAKSGGPNGEWVNIFKGILYSSDGSRLNVQNKGCGRRFVSAAAIEGRQGAADYIGIPVTHFEAAFLFLIGGTKAIEFGNTDGRADEIAVQLDAVEAQFAAVAERQNEIKAALLTTGTSAVSLVTVLAEMDAQKAELQKRRAVLRSELSSLTSQTPKDTVAQIAALVYGAATASGTESERMRLRGLIAQLVERIDVTAGRKGEFSTLSAEVNFKSGMAFTFGMEWTVKVASIVRVSCIHPGTPETLAARKNMIHTHIVRTDFSREPSALDLSKFWTPQEWAEAADREGIRELAARLSCHWSHIYRQITKAKAAMKPR